MSNAVADTTAGSPAPSVWTWGVPITPMTTLQVLDEVDRLIQAGNPSFFITANLNYAMLSSRLPDLPRISRDAAFIVADGMPLLWAARWQKRPLPERVAGSDLIYALCQRAAQRGHRIFLLGAGPGVAELAAQNLTRKYPGLQIVGTLSPPYKDTLSPEEIAQIGAKIQQARTDLLVIALSQPKGERWLHSYYQQWKVPVSTQIGATLDFAAGRIPRAPRWMQQAGLEWVYRFLREPRRLGGRYLANGLFLIRCTLSGHIGPPQKTTTQTPQTPQNQPDPAAPPATD
jgi:N-acetylglucosaminyldiphosphoundecaprenol N-acetyl-beta-D-mannosaminyltransferase